MNNSTHVPTNEDRRDTNALGTDYPFDHMHLIDISELDIRNSLDAKTERTVIGDNDSAKAGLESTDDMPNTTKLDLDIISTRERHMRSLAEMCEQIERTARDQYMEIDSVFRGEIDSLEKTIKAGEEERNNFVQLLHQKDGEIDTLGKTIKAGEDERRNLGQLLHQKDAEIDVLRGEIIQGDESHKQQLDEHRRQTQEEWSRAEEQYKQERQEALAALRAEMTAESEKRVSGLLEETGREAEERVNKVRAEMSRMRADFDKEREQTMREMKTEMVRLADREREARERSKRAEMAQRSDEYRQSLQTWAVARLWGVGQSRAR